MHKRGFVLSVDADICKKANIICLKCFYGHLNLMDGVITLDLSRAAIG